jgi:hypothetical protein
VTSFLQVHPLKLSPVAIGGADHLKRRQFPHDHPSVDYGTMETLPRPGHVRYPPGAVKYYAPMTLYLRLLDLVRNASCHKATIAATVTATDVTATGDNGVPGVAADAAGPARLPLVRITVTGDATMHRTVCALVALQQKYPELMQEVDVRVYVVPTEAGSMGTFLALVDPWYRKQVTTATSGNAWPRLLQP